MTKRDFTKQDFKNWLKEHESEIVGWVGYPSRPTPIFNYAQARGWDFSSLMPKWAYKCAGIGPEKCPLQSGRLAHL